MKKDEMKDLGLSYEQAAHGVQTAKALDLQMGNSLFNPKHLRVGIDMSKADMMGLVSLLIDKGVFTLEEYLEYIRLSANQELANEESRFPGVRLR